MRWRTPCASPVTLLHNRHTLLGALALHGRTAQRERAVAALPQGQEAAVDARHATAVIKKTDSESRLEQTRLFAELLMRPLVPSLRAYSAAFFNDTVRGLTVRVRVHLTLPRARARALT